MNGLSIAQATGNVDNADMVAAWVVVGLIIAVGCSMTYGMIRSWWLKRTQSIQSRRRQFATGGYQTTVKPTGATIKRVSTASGRTSIGSNGGGTGCQCAVKAD